MRRKFWMLIAVLGILLWGSKVLVAGEAFTIGPSGPLDADGKIQAIAVDSHFYTVIFSLSAGGAARDMTYKPLNHDLVGEAGYILRDWVRASDVRSVWARGPGPYTHLPATYRVVKQNENELVLEFESRNVASEELAWMDKVVNRRRVFIRNDSPAIRVEREVINTDGENHEVQVDLCNGLGLGPILSLVSIPSVTGKLSRVDLAVETSSSGLAVPEVAGDWIGGVNEQGLGGAFSVDWADVDAMQVTIHKQVGSSYWVVMRRRDIPAGQSVIFKYTFMPFTGFGALDGMKDDLVGGILVGDKTHELEDMGERARRVTAGMPVPVKVFLASGTNRHAKVHVEWVRKEDEKLILKEDHTLELRVSAAKGAETGLLNSRVTFPQEGLYVVTVTADDGAGTVLRMEKGLEVGKTRLVYAPQPPAGEKRGRRVAGELVGASRLSPIFVTVDPAFVTPHLPLLKNHASGTVKALFMLPAKLTMGHVREIAERSDMAYEWWVTGAGGSDWISVAELRDIRKKLGEGAADVFVSLDVDWEDRFPSTLIQELLNRVRDGMGGVVTVFGTRERQRALLAALEEAEQLPESAVAPMVPTVGPETRYYKLGKGRLVVLFHPHGGTTRDGGIKALGEWGSLAGVPIQEFKWRGFEYAYAGLSDKIRWAAQKESPVRITRATLDKDIVTAELQNNGAEIAGNLRVTARSRRWEVRARGEAAVQIPAGESKSQIKLTQPLDGGASALEIEIGNAQGKLVAFGSTGVLVPQGVRTRVIPEPQFQMQDKIGKCAVDVEGQNIAGAEIEVRVIDLYGRLVFKTRQPLEMKPVAPRVARGRVELDLSPIKALGIYYEVVADVYAPAEGGAPARLISEAVADLYLLPRRAWYDDHFVLAMANGPEATALHRNALLPSVRKSGFVLSWFGDTRALYATGGIGVGENRVSFRDRYARPNEEVKLDDKNLILTPPLLPNEEAYNAKKASWQAYVKRLVDNGARHVFIDDERKIADDYDFSPQTLAGLREWLKGRYASIAELNKTWGTQFADFSQVVPKPRKEIADGNLAPWLEFRMYIGEVLGEYYMKKPAEWAAEIAPDLSVSEMGVYSPRDSWPVDWARYARYYKRTTYYGGMVDIFRAFAPETIRGPWMGYGWVGSNPDQRVQVWEALLDGGHWLWIWSMQDVSQGYAIVTTDSRPAPCYEVLAREEFPDLMGGIDRLIMGSRFSDDRIGVGYSYPSWIVNTQALGFNSMGILRELGYQYRYINLEDIETKGLDKDICKVFVLEEAACLSAKQVEQIRKFVDAGGTVFCVGRSGWLDCRGTPHPQGSLMDELAGVDTSKGVLINRNLPVDSPDKSVTTAQVQYSGVLLKAARVVMTAKRGEEQLPVLTQRALGKGRVYWLNAAISREQGSPEESRWGLFRPVLAGAGLKPRCEYLDQGKPVVGEPTWYYASPSERSLFVAHYLMKNVETPLTVKFGRRGHIYEMRTGKYYGLTDTLEETFPPGKVRLFAILDYQVRGLTAGVNTSSVKAGDVLKLKCRILSGGKPPDLHAFRVHIFDPQGESLPAHFATLLAPNGEGSLDIPLALDQKPGNYRVDVLDVTSGVKASVQFTVTE